MFGIILCYIFATHFTLAALALVGLPFYGARDLWFSRGAGSVIARRTIWGKPKAQTLGWLVYWRNAFDRVKGGSTEDHELVHVRQCGYIQGACLPVGVWGCLQWDWPGGYLGALWVLAWAVALFPWPTAYGLASLWSRIRHGEWYYNHTTRMGNWFERRAYHLTAPKR